ncbi:Mitochondrial import inner membrane translocase subunit TIM16 [Strongyloides ratti]|uniref:Mitochondrial import inner membrane translocase subunit tim-16 n=1 Tax=Strongyloides ratti TaxID=34506 RepID=A0A090L3V4_STRRB|nr:Mitochondrial import inner membrane translocase subunit TIM16 [Strongyloides ratti]CEF64496.1 Mitochondrial import inner membrane translocase subunit TIM16 [Strongyloides ratti]
MVFKSLIKVIVASAGAVSKALGRAVKEEIKYTQQASERIRQSQNTSSNKNENTTSKLGISLHESCQILNVKEPFDPKVIEERYKKLFEVNDKSNGGSLYLQSKVFRAKERIDEELAMRAERESNNEKNKKEDL